MLFLGLGVILFLGAFSAIRCTLFVPKPGTKGFTLYTSEADWRSNRGLGLLESAVLD